MGIQVLQFALYRDSQIVYKKGLMQEEVGCNQDGGGAYMYNMEPEVGSIDTDKYTLLMRATKTVQ